MSQPEGPTSLIDEHPARSTAARRISGFKEIDRYKLLIESIRDVAIYMLDREGRVATWNPGAERFKGYTAAEIIGRRFSCFYTEADRAEGVPERNLEIARREGKYEGEGWRLRKNGEQFWASVVIDAIHDETGALIGFAKITRDVTDKRNAQQALEEAREALFQSQKVEAIGRLTGGVAHDFNNLLMAILGSLELAVKRLPDDPRLAALIGNAMEGAKRGAALTQRMLAFARRQQLDIQPTDVPKLVSGMMEMLQHALGPDFVLEELAAPDLPFARTDANQLEAALLNLVLNARDAMPGGGAIAISVFLRESASGDPPGLQPGAYVVLAVKDSGEGMDEATLARATEPFFTTKGVGKGTGLGLSMVQGHAEQSGGGLLLKSRKGGGTTAEIWLPAVSEAAAVERAPDPPYAAAPADRTLTVLAVDDDALVLMNTVAMLEDLGHRALSALSGEAALSVFRETPDIDAIITDQAMPRMTGLQLAEAVRAERPDLPVIIATGYAELPPALTTNVLKLAKPFTQHDLEQILRAVAPTQR